MREISKIIRDAKGEAVATIKRQVPEQVVLDISDLHDLNLPDGNFLFVHAIVVRVKDHIVDFVPVAGVPVDGVANLGEQVIDYGKMKSHIARTGRAFSVTQLQVSDAPTVEPARKREAGFIRH